MTKHRRARLSKSQQVLAPRASDPAVARDSRPSSDMQRASTAVALDAFGRKQCPSCGERYPSTFRVCPRDAVELQEEVADSDPLLGTVLADAYEIIRMIGEGAAGRVYEARHTRLFSKRFAIKVLHSDLTRQPEVVRRFVREAEATSALQHPNIMGVLDINTLPDGRPYLVAEFLNGEQLGDHLDREGKLSVADAVSICRSICRALIAAHDKNIIHRDIKPENVFLVGKGAQRVIKVLDFGISRVGDATGNLTKTGMVMGTPAYMPPEQARGVRVDHRADIYAVGTILYEAVTGQRAFDSDDPVGTLAAVLTNDPPRPRTLDPGIPPGLELVIQKAMAKKPSERYQTMRELDRALASFDLPETVAAERQERGLPVSTEPPVPNRRLWPWARALSWWSGDSAPEQARTRLAIISIAGAICAFAAIADLITSSMRWLRPASLTTEELTLAALAAAAFVIAPGIAWSRYLSARVWASTPRVLDVAARTKRVLTVSLVTYAVSMLSVRLFGSALHVDPIGVTWPGWSAVALTVTVIVGSLLSWLMQRVRKLPQ